MRHTFAPIASERQARAQARALRRSYARNYRAQPSSLSYGSLAACVVLAALCLTFGAAILGTAGAGDPHGYAYDLTHGRVCHALFGRGCISDPHD